MDRTKCWPSDGHPPPLQIAQMSIRRADPHRDVTHNRHRHRAHQTYPGWVSISWPVLQRPYPPTLEVVGAMDIPFARSTLPRMYRARRVRGFGWQQRPTATVGQPTRYVLWDCRAI